MIETGRSCLDADALLLLDADVSVDVLYVLTGRRAVVAAADMLDWQLVAAILDALTSATTALKMELSADASARALRLLYKMASMEGKVTQERVTDFLQISKSLTD